MVTLRNWLTEQVAVFEVHNTGIAFTTRKEF